jgi:hypothetical protein
MRGMTPPACPQASWRRGADALVSRSCRKLGFASGDLRTGGRERAVGHERNAAIETVEGDGEVVEEAVVA